ncbi:MAG: hypothetical protein RPT25_15400 [Cycloclasticus sp.]|jgi:hypothetical protein
MKNLEERFNSELLEIQQERKTYSANHTVLGKKVFDYLSIITLIAGFISLPLVYFTEVTLIHSACIFIISRTLSPSDTDRYELMIKGVAQDIANIRIATTVIAKGNEKSG